MILSIPGCRARSARDQHRPITATVQQQQSNIILVSSLLGDEHPQSPEQSGEAAGPLSQLSEPGDGELGAA